jgi:hypothetical protein
VDVRALGEELATSADYGIIELHGVLRHPVPQPRWCRPRGAIYSGTEVPMQEK